MKIFIVLLLALIYMPCIQAFDYRLAPGDHIKVSVYDEPDLSLDVKIDKSGVISFPFLNDINVVGLTTKELENQIYNGLVGDYLIEPQVSISMYSYRPFYIHGQVNRPGGYPYQVNLVLSKAIAIAGGLSSRASHSNWQITRIVNGKTITLDATMDSKVHADDIINIKQSFF